MNANRVASAYPAAFDHASDHAVGITIAEFFPYQLPLSTVLVDLTGDIETDFIVAGCFVRRQQFDQLMDGKLVWFGGPVDYYLRRVIGL